MQGVLIRTHVFPLSSSLSHKEHQLDLARHPTQDRLRTRFPALSQAKRLLFIRNELQIAPIQHPKHPRYPMEDDGGFTFGTVRHHRIDPDVIGSDASVGPGSNHLGLTNSSTTSFASSSRLTAQWVGATGWRRWVGEDDQGTQLIRLYRCVRTALELTTLRDHQWRNFSADSADQGDDYPRVSEFQSYSSKMTPA